jgi:uroporphyrinogen-III decarboxylase
VFALGLEFDYGQAGLDYGAARTDVAGVVRSQVEAGAKYGYDWAVIFPDDYVEFEHLGLVMRDDPDHPTMPDQYLAMDAETLRGLKIPDLTSVMRCPVHLEMLHKTKEALGDTVLVMGRIAAPFSTLGLIYGIDNLMVAMLDDPALVRDNMAFFVEHQVAFGKAQLEAGADLLWLGDCCAASNFIRPEHFREFAFEPAAKVAAALRDEGLLIYHSAETSLPHIEAQVELPVHAVNLGEGVSIAEVKQALDPQVALMGNFDCKLLRDGTPDEIAAETERMVRANRPGGRYMFNTGEGVMANTPPENVAAMTQAAKAVTRDRTDLR